jgi:predicted DNA-binding transcriptional regulator AlpA
MRRCPTNTSHQRLKRDEENMTLQQPAISPDPNTLVDEREAASILCYSVRALQNWRHRGGGPLFVRVSSRSIRYRRTDLAKWVEDRIVANTSQPI